MKNKYAIIFSVIILSLVTVAAVAGMKSRSTADDTGVADVTVADIPEQDEASNAYEAVDEDDITMPEQELPPASSDEERMVSEAELQQMMGLVSEDSSTVQPTSDMTPLPVYDEYLEINPYVAGWLSIDGTKIDDPVVYTPGSQNYFLHRALDGSDLERGTLFIAINWRDGFNNTLIYGHNMKDGSGFGSLLKYADSGYGMDHKIIHFDTLYEEREYELLGVFYSQIQEDELETEEDRAAADKIIEERSLAKLEEQGGSKTASEEGSSAGEELPDPAFATLTVRDLDLGGDWGDTDIYREEKDMDNGRFRYYYYTDLADRNDYEYYVRNVKERSLYDTGVSAEWGDELLTLSTCSYQVKNGRFVVVAVCH